MKPLLCFDLDNTLVYSEKAHFMSYAHALKKVLNTSYPYKKMICLFGRPHEEIVKILTKNASKSEIKKIMELHDSILVKKYYSMSKPIPGINKTLFSLKKDYSLALLSNCSQKNAKAILKGAKIPISLFSIIIGYDNVKHSKPAPDMMLLAEKKLNTRCLFMIGDSPYDLIAAKKAHIDRIAVLTGHYALSVLKKEKPHFILNSVNNLPGFLKLIAN
ncbi:MAG: HAD family hydrolase [Nanoarchaeota archaeon]